MHKETITRLLNIPGYCVTEIMKMTGKELHLKVEPEDGYTGRCSECGDFHRDEYHSSKMMTAEGLAIGDRRTILHIQKRRNWCDEVKAVRTEEIGWIQKGARVTELFARSHPKTLRRTMRAQAI